VWAVGVAFGKIIGLLVFMKMLETKMDQLNRGCRIEFNIKKVDTFLLKDIICGREKYLSLRGRIEVNLLSCQKTIKKYVNIINHVIGGKCKGLS
jgi:hypothetical protein